jgi:hypothetical protein
MTPLFARREKWRSLGALDQRPAGQKLTDPRRPSQGQARYGIPWVSNRLALRIFEQNFSIAGEIFDKR